MAIITREGFSGFKNLREVHYAWSPKTIIYNGKGNIILANPDAAQSRMGKLWAGPKDAAIVHNRLAKQKSQEVLDAIDRLSPYPVTRTTIWGAVNY